MLLIVWEFGIKLINFSKKNLNFHRPIKVNIIFSTDNRKFWNQLLHYYKYTLKSIKIEYVYI
jgi:hypothetical protein